MKDKKPLSLWLKKGNFVFVSGSTGWDPKTGKMPNLFREQMINTLERIKSALLEAGAKMNNTCMVTVFIRNHEDYDELNKIYATYFDPPYPTRTTIQANPRRINGKVEINAIAYIE